jgi:4-hydroxymandelate oxidase
LTSIPPQIACVADYESYAQDRVEAGSWAYLNSAAADQLTRRSNRRALDALRLLSRNMMPMRGGHTQLDLFGTTYAHPIFIAPVAYHRLAHPDGELATALAARAMQAPMVLSTLSSTALEEVAASTTATLWFQLYLQTDKAHTRTLVNRAEAAGYRALVVTIDAPVTGLRNAQQRAGFVLPGHISAANLCGMPSPPAHTAAPGSSPIFGSALAQAMPTWEDLAWLVSLTRLPVLVKGVLNPKDAQDAMTAGVAGIIVSNHGGRVLDTLPATIEALPAVAQAVAGRVPILLDGGIRRGTDIVKALALGASAVLVGLPVMHGLAAAGAAGVAHVLHMLRTELETAMVLCGCSTLGDINRDVLWQP